MKQLQIYLFSLIIFTFILLFTPKSLIITSIHAQCSPDLKNQGLISATEGLLGNTIFGNTDAVCIIGSQSDPDQSASYQEFKIPSYKELENQFYTLSSSPAKKLTPDPILAGKDWDFSSESGNGIYLKTGDTATVTVNSVLPIDPPDGTKIIFIQGNLDIIGNINYADSDSNSGLVFIVGGHINIYKTVTKVNAVLISSRSICTSYDDITGTCNNSLLAQQLVINGSIISIAKDSSEDTINLARNLSVNDKPAEIINKQAKYLYNLRGLLTKDLIITTEDQNYPIPSLEPYPSVIPSPSNSNSAPAPSASSVPSPSSSPPAPDLNLGLIAYWPMDETNLKKIVDVFQGRIGTLEGQGEHVTPPSNAKLGTSAVLFKSYDHGDYLEYSDVNLKSAGSVFTGDDLTLSFWFKADYLEFRNLFWAGQAGGNGFGPHREFHISLQNNKLKAYLGDNYNYPGTRNPIELEVPFTNTTSYQLVTLVLDKQADLTINATLYLNGGSVATDKGNNILKTLWTEAFLGTSDVGENFLGRMDEFGVWNRALTAGEVSLLYNNGNGARPTSVVTNPPPITNNEPGLTRIYQTAVNINSILDIPPGSTQTTGGAFWTGGPSDNFQVRWKGKILISQPGLYNFYLKSDDGSKLYFNNPAVPQIDNWSDHAMSEKSFSAGYLQSGAYNLVVDYYERGGNAGIELSWESSYFPKAIIPTTNLNQFFEGTSLPNIPVVPPYEEPYNDPNN